jgi:hypothetical protein
MRVTLEAIKAHLAQIVRDNPTGIGWYGAELRCRIPRADFPEGVNVRVVLEALTEAGTLLKSCVDGKERWFAADPDPLSKAS